MPTRKNYFRPPICTDERLRFVEVPCGKCYECRKKKARDWRIRMSEQLRETPHAVFFTGTFTDESIAIICNKYDINKEDAKEVATKAMRLYLERLRKDNNGKSVLHWAVTEKGHTNTRRIHIHGIFFMTNYRANFVNFLKRNWSYGYCYTGDYVNERTVNYIVKYMTKTDLDNPEFTGKVLCSPGIGKNYIKRWGDHHKYIQKQGNEKTNETYIFKNGQKGFLPTYYRRKLYTEEERELLWIEKIEEGKAWICGTEFSVKNEEEKQKFDNEIKNHYIPWAIRVHKDNPKMWEKAKKIKRRLAEQKYKMTELQRRKEYWEKEERRYKAAEKRLEKDLDEFKSWLYDS